MVHKAMHVSTHDVVAIKRINLNDVPEDDLQDLLVWPFTKSVNFPTVRDGYLITLVLVLRWKSS